jgi:hypothetical protein
MKGSRGGAQIVKYVGHMDKVETSEVPGTEKLFGPEISSVTWKEILILYNAGILIW